MNVFDQRKKLLEKTFLDFNEWVKSIQTAGYNGARTVYYILDLELLRTYLLFPFTKYESQYFFKYRFIKIFHENNFHKHQMLLHSVQFQLLHGKLVLILLGLLELLRRTGLLMANSKYP